MYSLFKIVVYFNARYKSLVTNLYRKGIGIINFGNTFYKFYQRRFELISEYNTGLRPFLQQGLSEPEFYGDLYKFRKVEENRIF